MKILQKIKLNIIVLLLIFSTSACLNNSNINPTIIELGSISGRVFLDENSNQICDCDCGIEDIKIRLFKDKCDGTFYMTVNSDEDGYYKFSDLEPGNYCVYPDISFSCEGFIPNSAVYRNIILEANQEASVDWFSYEIYYQLDIK